MLKSCSNLQSLCMPHVSIFLLRAVYSRWDTQRSIITLQLGIPFCLQVLSSGSKEVMVLYLLLFLTGNNNFYYIIPTIHLHQIGQTKREYCLQLRYQPRSWRCTFSFYTSKLAFLCLSYISVGREERIFLFFWHTVRINAFKNARCLGDTVH